MKKTYITTMPNHIGAFLKASECFAKLGINITRVSYNKAVDSHTLFIDAEGDEEKLIQADEMLTQIGYLHAPSQEKEVVLLEFMLVDKPGSVTEVLKLIDEYRLNISYISSQENGSGYQAFKMGLFVEDEDKFKEFLDEAGKLCVIRIIDYNQSENVYDNSIFYQSFVSELVNCLKLDESLRDSLLVNSNLVMQILDEKGLSPYKTFESISRFAHLLAACRGSEFNPRITNHKITDDTEIILIEPACGSNTTLIKSAGETLFIDSGYALYGEEMEKIFKDLLPEYETLKKRVYVTHADVDHCGLLPYFDEIIASEKTKECLSLEYNHKDGYREQNPLHKPYVNICKALTGYNPVNPDNINALWKSDDSSKEPLTHVGIFDVGELHFDVYEGLGGHLKGETVLIDYNYKIVFSGDIYINVHELTKEQAKYNQYAPVLMTSVDTDPELCAVERRFIMQLLDEGDWTVFGAHGMKKEVKV